MRTRFGLPVMKALPIAERADLSPIRLYAKVADRLMFDARAPREATRPGGLGKPFDWRLLENLDPGVPFMLSGGLDAGNVGRGAAHHAAPAASMFPPASSARRARRTPTRSAPSSAPRAALPPRDGVAERGQEIAKRMTVQQPNSFRTGPDERGHFGIYGGRFVAETLMPLILELEQAYADAKADPAFQREMDGYLTHYVGRPRRSISPSA